MLMGKSRCSCFLSKLYINESCQRVKIIETFNFWEELVQECQEIPILFKEYLNVYIYFLLNEVDICNLADNNTPYF